MLRSTPAIGVTSVVNTVMAWRRPGHHNRVDATDCHSSAFLIGHAHGSGPDTIIRSCRPGGQATCPTARVASRQRVIPASALWIPACAHGPQGMVKNRNPFWT